MRKGKKTPALDVGAFVIKPYVLEKRGAAFRKKLEKT
jgi:hypothetical protein